MFGNLLGKLTLADIPFDQPIIMAAAAFMALIVVAVVVGLTWFKKWGYLWSEWLTSVDHKKIGVMYIVVAVLMLLRGFVDALMMRTQLALAYNGPGFLPPEHYNQVFTAHGVIMIFFMAMAFMIGLMNIVVPLQIGARDVAFPFINSLSFWMTALAAILINISLVIGDFAQTGWLAYPPLSELQFSPGVGRRLLLVEFAALRHRHVADRHQLLRDHHQDARAGHDVHEDAGVHVDRRCARTC